MKYKNLLILSTGMKVVLILLAVSIIVHRYVVSASGKIWFNPIATPARVEDALKDDPRSVDVVDDLVAGLTGLMVAAQEGFVERAKLLIKYNASLNMQAKNENDKADERKYRNTALHFAVLNGDDPNSFEVAKVLINSGADVTVKNGKGFTVLHMLLSINDPKKRMELMKRMMAVVGQAGDRFSTAKTYEDREKIMQTLLKEPGNTLAQTAVLNAQTDEGNTMLHLSAQMNRMDWIADLIKEYGRMLKFDMKNKDKLGKNKEGRTPEELAKDAGSGDLARRLKKISEQANNKSVTDEQFKKLPFMSY